MYTIYRLIKLSISALQHKTSIIKGNNKITELRTI